VNRIIRSEVRDQLVLQLVAGYLRGYSIRRLARAYGLSFGTTRNLLLEGGATLRRPGRYRQKGPS
jgi:transposase-like protein